MVKKQQVVALIQGGQWTKAKEMCSRLCEGNPDDPEAWFYLAGVNAQLNLMEDVIECCQKVLFLQPNNIGAYYNLGVALQSKGCHAEAATAYKQVIVIEPLHALAYANLGLAERVLGKTDDALASCAKALQLRPELTEALNTYALALKDQGKLEQAVEYLLKAIKYNSSYADAYFNLGLCYEGLEQYSQAENNYQQAIAIRPPYHEAHARLGALLVKLGRANQAIPHYRRVLELKPDSVELYNELGNLLMDQRNPQNHYAEAEKCYRKALEYRSDLPEVHLNLAVLLQELGSFDEAKKHFQHALELKPDYDDAVAGMAMLFEHSGEFEDGMTLLRPFLTRGAVSCNTALAYAALARHCGEREEAVLLLEQLDGQPVTVRQRVDIHFSLGRLHDELKNYPKAFEHFRRANTAEEIRYDVSQTIRTFDELMEVFSKEKMDRRPRASNRSRLPVFIVGMPRSGTSLVEQILASHPEVFGAGELGDIHEMTTTISDVAQSPLPYPYSIDGLKRKMLDELADAHLKRLAQYSKVATRVTDKMPHNFLGLGLIDQLFPGGRIIHCKRDPVDTCLSIYFQRFNIDHPYAVDLAALGMYYRQYERLMGHWRSTLKIPYMEIQYEELVANQEEVSRAMVEFCGLKWDENCLRFYESKRVTTTISYDQVRRPIYTKSIARWKNYEPYLAPLLNELGVDT